MRRFVLAQQFLLDFRALERGMSAADHEIGDQLLATILHDAEDPRRFPTFYDPQRPTWLQRADPFLLHYAYDSDADEVTFLNIFRRR